MEHLHWEWMDIAVLQWVAHCTTMAVTVDIMAAIIIVCTS